MATANFECDDFIKIMKEKLNDPNTKFAEDSKLCVFSSTIHPGVVWEPYCGEKKCRDCHHTADNTASKDGKLLAYACKTCLFSMKFHNVNEGAAQDECTKN